MQISIELIAVVIVIIIGVIFVLSGLRIVRPTHRGIIETLGTYTRFQTPGITYIIPLFQRLYTVDITETMKDVDAQEMITQDNLNCTVDAQIYYKVNEEEDSIKNIFYKVRNFEYQIINLANTTLRNVVGEQPFDTVNSKRSTINSAVFDQIQKQIKDWGLVLVRVEIKVITPPPHVQEEMNQVIIAEKTKQAAKDYANATEVKAEGDKRAAIQKADGDKAARIARAEGLKREAELIAEGEANAIKMVNEAAEKYFIGNAKELKKLQVTQASLQNNTKYVVTEKGISPQLIINDTGVPIIPVTSESVEPESTSIDRYTPDNVQKRGRNTTR